METVAPIIKRKPVRKEKVEEVVEKVELPKKVVKIKKERTPEQIDADKQRMKLVRDARKNVKKDSAL